MHQVEAAQCGSPVVCCVNNAGVKEKIYCCQRWYQGDWKRKIKAFSNECRNGICCPFSFILRDEIGYDVHLTDFSYGRFEFKNITRWMIGWDLHNFALVGDDLEAKEGDR